MTTNNNSRFAEAQNLFDETESVEVDGVIQEFYMIPLNSDNEETIKLALKIADRLERMDVSEKMFEQIENYGEFFVAENVHYENVFKAMTSQLIKECEEEK